MLKYSNVDFEDIRYTVGGPPDYANDWFTKDKLSIHLDFPNLPYYIDDDVRLTHSKAIMRYLSRKHDLMGKTEEEIIRIDIIERQLKDFNENGLKRVAYGGTLEPLRINEDPRKDYLSNIDGELKKISDFLGSNEWFGGKRLTYVDFWAYEVIDWNRLYEPKFVGKYANIMKFMERFENLPHVKEYLKSDKYKVFPIFGPMGSFGGKNYNDGPSAK